MTGDTDTVHTYSVLAGFAFLFNVIMGNGPLALPAAFLHAGWLMSSVILLVLCFTSFVTFTFIVEAMSITNAVTKLKKSDEQSDVEVEESRVEPDHHAESYLAISQPNSLDGASLRDMFEIDRKFELGEMFNFYFGKIGNILFYLNISIYLYGDLSIYAAGVPKSLRNVVCTSNGSDVILPSNYPCWPSSTITRGELYRIFVAGFAVCMGPFLFFHITRSRFLQLSTTAIRWLSFILMLCLAIDRAIVVRRGYTSESLHTARVWNPALHQLIINTEGPVEPVPNPPIIVPKGIPSMFGVCVYAFMCHHSVPGTVTPIRNKRGLMFRLFLPLFISSFAFNVLLSGSAVAAFNEIKDFYTLNFVPDEQAGKTFHIPYLLAEIFGYFLSLFPVFALSSTFPIVGSTLLGNLKALCNMFQLCHTPRAHKILRFTLPLVVLLPPIFIGLSTDDIGFLVGFTGAFAGTGIQYVIPAILVYRARCRFTAASELPSRSCDSFQLDDEQALCPTNQFDEPQVRTPNCISRLLSCMSLLWSTPWRKIDSPHASPFQHVFWITLLLIWSIICIVVVFVDKIHLT